MFRFLILLALLSTPFSARAEVVTLPEGSSKELLAFYALRSNTPAWNLSDEASLKRAQAFVTSVEALINYHGLEKDNYHLDTLRQLAANTDSDDKQKLEPLITLSLLHLAHDLHGDNGNLESLYPGWTFRRQQADIPSLVNDAIAHGTLESFFEKIAPQNPTYRSLAQSLQTYRTIAAKGNWPTLTLGKSLHPKDKDPRVEELRARLAAEGYLSSQDATPNDVFDADLKQALIAYQTRNGLQPDGNVGAKTQEALNVPLAERINQIRANMERWRHMPEDFPPARYTVVNIPEFTITIIEDGAPTYEGLVVDGRSDRATPFINSKIVNMVVNPSWHVPLDLARKDILPKLQKDPYYLEKQGIVITNRTDDPSGTSINWSKVTPEKFNYQLRQNPSDLNSLGQLKFNFKNPFDVYMHGTPHQELFSRAERNFSSGCVRLEEPQAVAEVLLKNNKDKGGWTQERIVSEIAAEKTYFVPLTKPMPVYFVYWTVFAGDDRLTNFRKDIYGYDDLLIEKLKDPQSASRPD